MRKFPWFTAILATVFGVCSGLILFGLIRSIQGDKVIGSADVAAWVQALAATAALIGAIAIAHHQNTTQRRTQREQQLVESMKMSRLATIATQRVVPEIEDYFHRIRDWPVSAGAFVYDPYHILESKVLLDMAVAKIDHPEVVEPIIAVQLVVGSFLKQCNDQQGAIHPWGHSRVRMFAELWRADLAKRAAVIDAVAKSDEAALARFQSGGL